ncbi:MAG: zinc ribbon domain-containing protein [Candidatus Bathyarchaeota archaeon]|nr:MAG: zinc ribbon domain-containing protein [Candidatus Bathyarchaeota archaeon]
MPEKEESVSASFQHSLRPASDSFNSSITSFCPKCGTKVSEGITYCPQCGEKLGAK